MAEQPGFFDVDERLRALSASGDPLERLKAVVDCVSACNFDPLSSGIGVQN